MPFAADDLLLPVLIVVAIVTGLIAIAHARACARHARARRPLRATHRFAWMLVFLLLALLSGGGAITLRGYRLLTARSRSRRSARATDAAAVCGARRLPRRHACDRLAARRRVATRCARDQVEAERGRARRGAALSHRSSVGSLSRRRRRRRRRSRASSTSAANRSSTCGSSSNAFRTGCRGSIPNTAAPPICRCSMAAVSPST